MFSSDYGKPQPKPEKQVKPKLKKCPGCKRRFEPKYPTTLACSVGCAVKVVQERSDKQKERTARKDKKEKLEGLMSHSEWLNLLQKVFNTFVRKRDENKGCITCGTRKSTLQYHAGHYFAVSISPALRFHEDNVHLQCASCNNYLSGNLIEYTNNLPLRIGIERFEKLKELKNGTLKLSVSEIQVLIAHYRAKIKELK